MAPLTGIATRSTAHHRAFRPSTNTASRPTSTQDSVDLGGARTAAEASVAASRTLRELQRTLRPTPSATGLAVADHLCEPGSIANASKGIRAAHRPSDFQAALQGRGRETVPRVAPAQVEGAEIVRYQLLTKDNAGNLTSTYAASRTKTLFEPQAFPRERLARLADTVFEHTSVPGQPTYVRYGQTVAMALRNTQGKPVTLGFETEANALAHVRAQNVALIDRPAAELRSFATPEWPSVSKFARVVGAGSKALGALGVIGGGAQLIQGVQELRTANSLTGVVNGGSDLIGGGANAVSGASALVGADLLATRCGAAGALLDGGRDVYNGVLGPASSPERAAVGLTKMAAARPC